MASMFLRVATLAVVVTLIVAALTPAVFAVCAVVVSVLLG